MKKTLVAVSVFGLVAALLFGAQTLGLMDWQIRTTPGNPASGFMRTWANSSGNFGCLTSAGATCTVDPQATSSVYGVVKPDNSTITVSGGVISASGATGPTGATGSTGATGATGSGGLTQIAQVVLGSPAAAITFSSIPATYTGLQVWGSWRSAKTGGAGDVFDVTINGDTNAHYTSASSGVTNAGAFQGTSGTAVVAPASAGVCSLPSAGMLANVAESITMNLMDYRSAFYKYYYLTCSTNVAVTNQQSVIQMVRQEWQSTAAITSISFALTSGSNFVAGSQVTLYGLQ